MGGVLLVSLKCYQNRRALWGGLRLAPRSNYGSVDFIRLAVEDNNSAQPGDGLQKLLRFFQVNVDAGGIGVNPLRSGVLNLIFIPGEEHGIRDLLPCPQSQNETIFAC